MVENLYAQGFDMLGKRHLVILCYSLIIILIAQARFFFVVMLYIVLVMSGRAEKTRVARVGSTKLGPSYICHRKRW